MMTMSFSRERGMCEHQLNLRKLTVAIVPRLLTLSDEMSSVLCHGMLYRRIMVQGERSVHDKERQLNGRTVYRSQAHNELIRS